VFVRPGFSRVARSRLGSIAGETRPPEERLRRRVTLVDGRQVAAVLRINALWYLHCCALAVCGFGEGRREAVIGVDLVAVDAEGGGAARLTDIEHDVYVPALGLIQWFLQTSSLEAKRMDQ